MAPPTEGRPIFLEIADQIAADILVGTYGERAQVPSTNEFAAFHRINPATALKGVTLLVDAGILYKKRGIGMFVATGARQRILDQRRAVFEAEFVRPLIIEAAKLGISSAQLIGMIKKEEK